MKFDSNGFTLNGSANGTNSNGASYVYAAGDSEASVYTINDMVRVMSLKWLSMVAPGKIRPVQDYLGNTDVMLMVHIQRNGCGMEMTQPTLCQK